MMDDPYNFVDEDDSLQKTPGFQGQPNPFTPNGYSMLPQPPQIQQSSQNYPPNTPMPPSIADKNVKKRGRKKKGDEIRYVL